MDVGPESLIIKTFEVQDISQVQALMDQLPDKLSQLLAEQGLSEEDIKDSKLMSIMPKLTGISTESSLVKNKYVITENPKIWEEILNQVKNGNS